MERASLKNPSHPKQEPWEGLPQQVLWEETPSPRIGWIPWAVVGLVGLAVIGGMLVRSS